MVSQHAVEVTLGRLLCSARFRRAFTQTPEAALRQDGLQLTPEEIDALSRLPQGHIEALAALLDPRIVEAPNGDERAGRPPRRDR